MKGLTLEEKQLALQYAINGADFMFEPSPELCNKIVQSCPESIGINHVMTAILLQRKSIRLDSQMIIKYCQGTLDKNNTWLFNNGNIKVVPHQLKKEVKLKSKDDKTMKNKTKIEKKDSRLLIEEKIKKEENNNEE